MPMTDALVCCERCGSPNIRKEWSAWIGDVYECKKCWHAWKVPEAQNGPVTARRTETPRSPRIAPKPSHHAVTELEQRFMDAWAGGPEYEFDVVKPDPHRRWRFDFAWVDAKVAVECEGYDHRLEQRYHSDIEKYNRAVALGWRVFRCTTRLMQSDASGFCQMVLDAIRKGERDAD